MTLIVKSSNRVKLTSSTTIERENSKNPFRKDEISFSARLIDVAGGTQIGIRLSDEKTRPVANEPNPFPVIVADNPKWNTSEDTDGIL